MAWKNIYTPNGHDLRWMLATPGQAVCRSGVDYINLGGAMPHDITPAEVSSKYTAALNGVAYTGTFVYPHPLVGAPTPTPTVPPSPTPTAPPPPTPTATPTPTAIPTATPTPTAIPTATPTPTPGSFAAVILATEPANLKGYWKCNETSGTTLADSSGNAKNLTITGAINTNYWLGESGEQGTCFRTDGVAGYASRNDSVIPSLNSTNFTLFALFKGGTDFTAGNALSISSSLSGNDRAGMGAVSSSSQALLKPVAIATS